MRGVIMYDNIPTLALSVKINYVSSDAFHIWVLVNLGQNFRISWLQRICQLPLVEGF